MVLSSNRLRFDGEEDSDTVSLVLLRGPGFGLPSCHCHRAWANPLYLLYEMIFIGLLHKTDYQPWAFYMPKGLLNSSLHMYNTKDNDMLKMLLPTFSCIEGKKVHPSANSSYQ